MLANDYSDVIISAMASHITGFSILICFTVCSGIGQRKHQSPKSLAFVRGMHRWAVDSPHKGPVTRQKIPFDDVIMLVWFEVPNDIPYLSLPMKMDVSVSFIYSNAGPIYTWNPNRGKAVSADFANMWTINGVWRILSQMVHIKYTQGIMHFVYSLVIL